MSLLGPPGRRPALQNAYLMPYQLYDPTDDCDHPLLVVSLDQVTRTAQVVTRTSSFHARGPKPVAHAPAPSLRLNRPGWWRTHARHTVTWLSFDDDVEHLGKIDDGTWERVLHELTKVRSR